MEGRGCLRLPMPAREKFTVLTIAGSDSGGGAGIQADARTIQALGGYAAPAITAVTAQNGSGISDWKPVTPRLIERQIQAVVESLWVKAVKTGLLPNPATVRVVANILGRHPAIPLVVDPVLGSTSGTPFLAESGLRALRLELFPRATLVTPNWPEAAALTGLQVKSHTDAQLAAVRLMATGPRAVLVKGGHGRGRVCRDCLVLASGEIHWFENPRIETPNTHGTGCVLSAAIAAHLARGEKIETAVAKARLFLWLSLKENRSVRWPGGRGPAFPG